MLCQQLFNFKENLRRHLFVHSEKELQVELMQLFIKLHSSPKNSCHGSHGNRLF